jgi:multidrug efflux pump subunit AcrA (membrane-fusion protein)
VSRNFAWLRGVPVTLPQSSAMPFLSYILHFIASATSACSGCVQTQRPILHIAFLLTMANISFAAEKANPQRAVNTVVLDENGVKNLKIETVETEETDFEETIFSLGRIESIPEKRAVVSSRIPGRVIEIKASVGDLIEAGAEVVKIESRQAGDPPPSVMLKAPLGGLVSSSESRLGQPVEPDKALLEITDLSEVFAVARVPEHLAGKLKPGTIAHIRLSALPDEKFEGTLLRFGTAADKESGTLDAVFRLPNPSLTLRQTCGRSSRSFCPSARGSLAFRARLCRAMSLTGLFMSKTST